MKITFAFSVGDVEFEVTASVHVPHKRRSGVYDDPPDEPEIEIDSVTVDGREVPKGDWPDVTVLEDAAWAAANSDDTYDT